MNHSSYWLTNVRLETGYQFENDRVVGTKTDLHHIKIENGKIAEILSGHMPADSQPKLDAKEQLMLPALREMHIHIDKTYYGGPWQAIKPSKSILDKFAEERELLPKLLPTAKDRAEGILDLLLGYGSTHVRTHCNIDPVVGLRNLEATMEALDSYTDKLSSEVVAFPQHGLLRSGVETLMRDALKQGATLVGGVDPYTVDEDIDKSLSTIFDIAVEANAGVDIHLHDRDSLGIHTMHRLADFTEQAGLQGKVTVSHAFGFANVPTGKVVELAERFAELGIGITSTVPIGKLIMPIPLLHDKNVQIDLGTDSLTDHWSPFGTGDNLEKASRLAELYGYVDELSLSQALGFITGGKTPLDKEGKQTWPVVGDEASLNLVQATCSAEAVARRANRGAVFFKGNLVAGTT
ncbi:amidohydrolase family protein [Sporosarcina sp. Te-1]|uniref:amidohydrolase family protein n=1 Tax=Sporosarcina sp. Te-1 TaxID=2818390 RepID=UPI001A9E7572|nr:amidohydrolase family protein [Sporosarcina sp. Te-1]QTD42528.1 amidohydrolase family protein [Sporosarcina sp. Te-1]